MGGTALARQRVIAIKPRTYLHFDPPLSDRRRKEFSVTPEQVVRHSFLPFIGFDQVERRIDFESQPFWDIRKKTRAIRYASHNDSAIHSYYCDDLNKYYEDELNRIGISECVLAYRAGVGSNINFAKDLFDEVKARGQCVVACYDVSKFFDSLYHEHLEFAILNVTKREHLSKDWIKIFRRITQYEWANSRDIRKIIGRSTQPNRVCSIQQFRKYVRPIIQRNDSCFGIPQGSPLSGTLANVYMLSFDTRLSKLVRELGGSYRRYSDDIAIVLPTAEHLESVEAALHANLGIYHLKLNSGKSTVTYFFEASGYQSFDGSLLQYLGFTYDGSRILLRSSSLSRFFSRMKAGIRVSVRAAYHAGYPESEIRRRTLVGRFTHWGDRRNFVQYAYRASRIMNSPQIRRQLRNHVLIFQNTMIKYRTTYYSKATSA
jgi:hypothetical protein